MTDLAFDPDRHYTPAEVEQLLALPASVVQRWLVKESAAALEEGARGIPPMGGAELERLWTERPPRVRFSRAPIALRAELVTYAGTNVTRREEVQRLVSLVRFLEVEDIEGLWGALPESVHLWTQRGRSHGRVAAARDQRQELRYFKPCLRAIAQAHGRELPNWMNQLMPESVHQARTDPDRFVGHRWEADLNAAIAQVRGTRAGAASRVTCVRQLAFHLDACASNEMSLGDALASAAVVCSTFAAMRDRSQRMHGSWRSSTEKHLLEAVRPVLQAGAVGGSLSHASAAALARLLRDKPSFRAFEVPALVRDYRTWARSELRRADIKPQAGQRVAMPTDEEAKLCIEAIGERIDRLTREHVRRGRTLDAFVDWQAWAPDLREALGDGLAAHFLTSGGLRGGSLHGQQPRYMQADDCYVGAVRIDRVIVKRVAHESADGITTSHDNRVYDPLLAPWIECSTWTALPITAFRYGLRQLMEWYLHSCGQCLGPANRCDAAPTRVLREVRVAQDSAGRWAYDEAAQAHVPARTSYLSKHGEWLATLRAPAGAAVVFNPLWWSRDGTRPVLQDGLADRLALVLGTHLHRWRHFSLGYLMTAYPFSLEEAARLIHMDPLTAKKIYDNPSDAQILGRATAKMQTREPAALTAALESSRQRTAYLGERVAELEHQIAYLATVFGPLPAAPTRPGPQAPAPGRAIRRRLRLSPRGGDAFAA